MTTAEQEALKLFEDWATHFSAINNSDGSMTPHAVLDTIRGRRLYLASLGVFGWEYHTHLIKERYPYSNRRYSPGLATP